MKFIIPLIRPISFALGPARPACLFLINLNCEEHFMDGKPCVCVCGVWKHFYPENTLRNDGATLSRTVRSLLLLLLYVLGRMTTMTIASMWVNQQCLQGNQLPHTWLLVSVWLSVNFPPVCVSIGFPGWVRGKLVCLIFGPNLSNILDPVSETGPVGSVKGRLLCLSSLWSSGFKWLLRLAWFSYLSNRTV